MSGTKISHTPISAAAAHGVAAAVPIIEIARPPTRAARWAPRPRNGCRCAPSCSMRMRAHLVEQPPMAALARSESRRPGPAPGRNCRDRSPTIARHRRRSLVFDRRGRRRATCLRTARAASVRASAPSRRPVEIEGFGALGAGHPGRGRTARPGRHECPATKRDRRGVPSSRASMCAGGAGFTARPRCLSHIREMVRSEENQPILAMLRTAVAVQPAGSAQAGRHRAAPPHRRRSRRRP